MVSTSTLVEACDATVARLHHEKLALIEAVLQLKVEERAYWHAALTREQAFVALSPPAQGPTAINDEHDRERKIREYQERIAAADTSEEELRVMLEECRCHVNRSTSTPQSNDADDLARILQRLKIRDNGVHPGRSERIK